ncbi:MAG: FG-GAP repeat domain-containing protein [Planctomycetota bacterium]|jgi:hypothetical protein
MVDGPDKSTLLYRVFGQARLAWAAGALAGICLLVGRGQAMINPSFTPIDLTNQSRTILIFNVGALQDDGSLPVNDVVAVKGDAPQEPIAFAVTDDFVAEEVDRVVGNGPAAAMLFIATGQADEENDADDGTGPWGSAFLSVNGSWFELIPPVPAEGGRWQLAEDSTDKRSMWDGGTEMLARCVDYVLRAGRRAAVPVECKARWASPIRIAQMSGPVTAASAVYLPGCDLPSIFIACQAGDRVFQFDRRTGAFGSVAEFLAVRSRSQSVAFGDLSADGQIDIASWDGGALTFWLQSADGAFGAGGERFALPDGCEGLDVIDVGIPGRAGLVVSGRTTLDIVRPQGKDGPWSIQRLVAVPIGEKQRQAVSGQARPAVVADFDNDGLADILRPFENGALLYRATGVGRFAASEALGDLQSGRGPAEARAGDFDADGRLDVVFTGKGGLFLWRNTGDGGFCQHVKLGEPDYIARPRMSGGSVCDVNRDGRQEFVAFYGRSTPHVFFSRGFATFGFAGELDLMKGDLLPDASMGQQAGFIADVTGDGGQDMVMVLTDGSVWVVPLAVAADEGFAVSARLPVGSGRAGPVTVTGWSGRRCLGAWNITAGGRGGLFSRNIPGPVTLRWRAPDGSDRQLQGVTEVGPAEAMLRDDKTAAARGRRARRIGKPVDENESDLPKSSGGPDAP